MNPMKKSISLVLALLFYVSILPWSAGAVPPNASFNTTRTNDLITRAPWVDVRSDNAVINGSDTRSYLQISIDRMVAAGGEVFLPQGVYSVAKPPGSSYVLTGYSNMKLRGVPGKTIIKLMSADGDCSIFGSSSFVDNVSIDGVTFDGNKSVVSAVNTSGLLFPNVQKINVTNSVFRNFTLDAALLGETTLAGDVYFYGNKFSNTNGNGVRAYHIKRLHVINNTFDGFVKSSVDTNPSATFDNSAEVKISWNTINNGAAWTAGYSTLSLLGDKIDVIGNTIVGGGAIVVHSTYTRTIGNYKIALNTVDNSVANAIDVNQDTNTKISVVLNTLTGFVGSGVSVVLWDNAATPTRETIIALNTIEEGSGTYTWTNEPASIKLVGAANVKVALNTIKNPRFAGIEVAGNAADIVLDDNDIFGHKGQAPTDTTTRWGAPIILIDQGGAIRRVTVQNNNIYNYLTAFTPDPYNPFASGIVLYGVSSDNTAISDVLVKNNTIRTGNGPAIYSSYTTNSIIEGNRSTGYLMYPFAGSNNPGLQYNTLISDAIPSSDNTYYLGENTGAFRSWKGITLKDTINGKHYKVTIDNGVVTPTALD